MLDDVSVEYDFVAHKDVVVMHVIISIIVNPSPSYVRLFAQTLRLLLVIYLLP